MWQNRAEVSQVTRDTSTLPLATSVPLQLVQLYLPARTYSSGGVSLVQFFVPATTLLLKSLGSPHIVLGGGPQGPNDETKITHSARITPSCCTFTRRFRGLPLVMRKYVSNASPDFINKRAFGIRAE